MLKYNGFSINGTNSYLIDLQGDSLFGPTEQISKKSPNPLIRMCSFVRSGNRHFCQNPEQIHQFVGVRCGLALHKNWLDKLSQLWYYIHAGKIHDNFMTVHFILNSMTGAQRTI